MQNWQLLVVEDDPDGQEVVGRILRHHNIAHVVVGTGEEALETLASQPFTGALIDLALPGMDGWRLLQEIQHHYAIPCVAVTAFHSAEVAVQAIDAGFAAYFSKPLDATSFVRELASVF